MIIVGTGAGGGTLAYRLAPSGKRILLLERGGYLPRERENWDSEEVFGRERYVTTELWYDKRGVAFRPHAQYFVGGNTKVYGGVLFRLRERDFEKGRALRRRLPGVAHLIQRPRAVLRPGRAPLSRPWPGRRGPDRAAAVGAVPLSRRLPRAADTTASRRSPQRRPSAVSPPGRRRSGRIRSGDEPLRSLRPVRRVPLPDRRQGRRARGMRTSRPQAPERHAADSREGHAAGGGLLRALGKASRGGATRATRRSSPQTWWSSLAGRSTPPRCCCARPATRIPTVSRTRPTSSAGTTWRT